ncbi:MAG: hypothetical protein KBD37_09015 [Burkholderiales bacterium]|nr:hypothetical protein [Burkholderiales bacterium]
MEFLTLIGNNTYGQIISNHDKNEYTLIHCLPEEKKQSTANLCTKINETLFTPQSAQHLMQCLDTGKYVDSLELDNHTNQQFQDLFNQILTIKVDNASLPLNKQSKLYLAIAAYLALAKNDKSGKSIQYTDEAENSYSLTYYSRTHKILTAIQGTSLTPPAAKHLRECLKNNEYYEYQGLSSDHTTNEQLQHLFNLIKPIKINSTSWLYTRSDFYNMIKEYLESIANNIPKQIRYTENNISYTLISQSSNTPQTSLNDLFTTIQTMSFTDQTAQHLMQCLDDGEYINSLELDDQSNQQLQDLFNQILSIKIVNNSLPLTQNSECYLTIIKYLTFIKDSINGQVVYSDADDQQYLLTHHLPIGKLFQQIQEAQLTCEEGSLLFNQLIYNSADPIIYDYDRIPKNKTKHEIEECLNGLYQHIVLLKPTTRLTTQEEINNHPYHIILNYLGKIITNQQVEEITYTPATKSSYIPTEPEYSITFLSDHKSQNHHPIPPTIDPTRVYEPNLNQPIDPKALITLLQTTQISQADAKTILASLNPNITLTFDDENADSITTISQQLNEMKNSMTTDTNPEKDSLFHSIMNYLALIATNTQGIVMLPLEVTASNFLISKFSMADIVEISWLKSIDEQELPHENFFKNQTNIILNLESNKKLHNKLSNLLKNENFVTIMQGYFIYKMLMSFNSANQDNSNLAINFDPNNLGQFIKDIQHHLDTQISLIWKDNAMPTSDQQKNPYISLLLRSLFLCFSKNVSSHPDSLQVRQQLMDAINKYNQKIPTNSELRYWGIVESPNLTSQAKSNQLERLAPIYPRAWLTLGNIHYSDPGFTALETALNYYRNVADTNNQPYFSRAAYIYALHDANNNFEGDYQFYQTILRYRDPISGEIKKLPEAIIPENASSEALTSFRKHLTEIGETLWPIKPMRAIPLTPHTTPKTPHRRNRQQS